MPVFFLVHLAEVGNDVAEAEPEVAVLVAPVRDDALVDRVNAALRVAVAVRQLALLHEEVKHVLHVPHEARLVVVGRGVDAENGGDVRRGVGDASKFVGALLSGDVRVDVAVVVGDVAGEALQGANRAQVRDHGGVLEPVIAGFGLRVVVGGHGLRGDGVVEAAELAFDVRSECVAVGPVHELLVLVGHFALSI